jgi:hypothetical protein
MSYLGFECIAFTNVDLGFGNIKKEKVKRKGPFVFRMVFSYEQLTILHIRQN